MDDNTTKKCQEIAADLGESTAGMFVNYIAREQNAKEEDVLTDLGQDVADRILPLVAEKLANAIADKVVEEIAPTAIAQAVEQVIKHLHSHVQGPHGVVMTAEPGAYLDANKVN